MLRMRLRRTGAKKQPRYRVVIAEARSPRDGDFVDSIGYYDPLTEPATIRIDRDKALSWIQKGAQPSDTVVRLLKRSGITTGEAAAEGESLATAEAPEAEEATSGTGRSAE
jgi:small subunit ribosomal protein S16